MTPEVGLLVGIMSDFEHGEGANPANPFDVEIISDRTVLNTIEAFANMAVTDTPMPGDGDRETALVIAGLLQGMWIGWEYAHRSKGIHP